MSVNISVIIPTYSPKEYIHSCLDSLKNQSLSSDRYEVILILNGVKDPYYDTLKTIIEESSNFKLIYTELGNVSNARNVGLTIASGEYITFIDDDDVVSQTYLSDLYKNATTDCVSLSNMAAFEDGSNKPAYEYIADTFNKWHDKTEIKMLNIRSYFSIPVSKMIHRSIIGETRFNERFKSGEDGLFMFEISKNVKSIKFTSEDAIYYRRIRSSSLSNAIKSDKRYIFKTGLSLIGSYIKIYMTDIKSYNMLFFVSRILAVVKWIVVKS